MIKIVLLVVCTGSFIVASQADEAVVAAVVEARQQYPDSPFFHSVAYPFGYGWGIAAFVLAVFKAVFVFSAYVIWASFEAGFGRERSIDGDGRANEYQWIDAIVQLAAPDATDECRREVICEAEAYVSGNPLLRILSQFGGGTGNECRMATFSGVCRSITIQDVIVRQIRPFFNYQSNVNWGTSILNKLL
ncbi:uncharacterized protein LOC109423266 isoform X1 [Aedes albopictus]|uniref:Uncharacterized protein n=1 Tax=Aedes albopictus TaxID=7160 RepID=A0ABM1XR52_AEDAL